MRVPYMEPLLPIWAGVDEITRRNLGRVLGAFQAEAVGPQHFAGVTGYGHDDLGRDCLDRVFARAVGAQSAAVRVQFVSGTHAIACALFGVLRPGDELLAVCGAPYDTLETVIGLRGQGEGSLRDFGVSYRELALVDGQVDWSGLAQAIGPRTKLCLIQRSCGYAWRTSLDIAGIERAIGIIKRQNPDCVCFVDNCYGEFVEALEPTMVGADLMAGSLIK
ncbi:methionine gamma-lyase family protein, partial [Candidatus Cyanaurora vandensis]|uniref:methionine gamma-lyase family protein n=1 Tax=Candidatus Cyanaurora vandensis TaxID=2714958 RepID=UPI00257C3A01